MPMLHAHGSCAARRGWHVKQPRLQPFRRTQGLKRMQLHHFAPPRRTGVLDDYHTRDTLASLLSYAVRASRPPLCARSGGWKALSLGATRTRSPRRACTAPRLRDTHNTAGELHSGAGICVQYLGRAALRSSVGPIGPPPERCVPLSAPDSYCALPTQAAVLDALAADVGNHPSVSDSL